MHLLVDGHPNEHLNVERIHGPSRDKSVRLVVLEANETLRPRHQKFSENHRKEDALSLFQPTRGLLPWWPPHRSLTPTDTMLSLMLLLACTCSASKTAFTADDLNVYITTPGRNGSVIIDGSVDVKQMMAKYEILVSTIGILNSTLQDALAVNGEQQVGCCWLVG
jgi:hypothetical protein